MGSLPLVGSQHAQSVEHQESMSRKELRTMSCENSFTYGAGEKAGSPEERGGL